MKVLTVRNPWALAFFLNAKDIENRDWYTRVRGRIAIHAASGMGKAEYSDAAEVIARTSSVRPPTLEECLAANGHILGTVYITDCVAESASPWFFGKYGFVVREAKRFETPVKVRGTLGFWDWMPETGL